MVAIHCVLSQDLLLSKVMREIGIMLSVKNAYVLRELSLKR